MFTCKCPAFVLDAYFHSLYAVRAYQQPLPCTDVYTSLTRITSFLRNSFNLSTLPHFGPDPIACHKSASPLFSTLQ